MKIRAAGIMGLAAFLAMAASAAGCKDGRGDGTGYCYVKEGANNVECDACTRQYCTGQCSAFEDHYSDFHPWGECMDPCWADCGGCVDTCVATYQSGGTEWTLCIDGCEQQSECANACGAQFPDMLTIYLEIRLCQEDHCTMCDS